MTKLPMTYHTGIQGHEDWPVGHFGYSETDPEGGRAEDVDMYCFIRMNESMCVLPIRKGRKNERVWGWDGDLEKPTLKPSVLHQPSVSMLPWHGFVIQGELVTS